MLPCLPMLLLMGLSAGTVTADEGLALGAEAGSWITLTLEDGGIHLQLQEVKRGKASQFFGLMGKQEYLLSSQTEQLHHQSIRKDKWCRASWAGRDHLQKAERTRSMGQSEHPHRTLPGGRTRRLLPWTMQLTVRPGQLSSVRVPCARHWCVPPGLTELTALPSRTLGPKQW
ncbi:tachykinin-4 isoform X2 [Leptonychotes weddellii]|uniref:Tachykinin-4 isoform X2 n=1 Tax=Leptonychotes weddellii TaxID=9713 RepID=A0A7F8Q4Z8_LEPWE|nr:tachykinin-4 isoform X2 [Leptonychotes weddellii]